MAALDARHWRRRNSRAAVRDNAPSTVGRRSSSASSARMPRPKYPLTVVKERRCQLSAHEVLHRRALAVPGRPGCEGLHGAVGKLSVLDKLVGAGTQAPCADRLAVLRRTGLMS